MHTKYHDLATQYDTPLLLLDCDKLRRQYSVLTKHLPGVECFYALKALSHPGLITTLAKLGCKFDVASAGEIKAVRECAIPAQDCILSNPCKTIATMQEAKSFGIDLTVADSVDELHKLVEHNFTGKVLLRLQQIDPQARIQLSNKFGCTLEQVPELVECALSLSLDLAEFY